MGKGGEKSKQDENITLESAPVRKDDFEETGVVYKTVSLCFFENVVQCKRKKGNYME